MESYQVTLTMMTWGLGDILVEMVSSAWRWQRCDFIFKLFFPNLTAIELNLDWLNYTGRHLVNEMQIAYFLLQWLARKRKWEEEMWCKKLCSFLFVLLPWSSFSFDWQSDGGCRQITSSLLIDDVAQPEVKAAKQFKCIWCLQITLILQQTHAQTSVTSITQWNKTEGQ